MKKDDLLKYLISNQCVYHTSCKDVYADDLCNFYKCKIENIYIGKTFLPEYDYLVTDDSIGLLPDFLILYPEGHMLFFTLIE